MSEDGSPFYVHCHHGKHRGPAAAAMACVALGEIGPKEALKILERAGTSKDYAGLWRDVENYTPPPPDAPLPALPETAEVSSLVAAMSQIDRYYDSLGLCQDSNSEVPHDHPDLVPSQEALLLREGLHEAARNLSGSYDPQFKTWLADAEQCAAEIERTLKKKDTAAAGRQFQTLGHLCKQCHSKYRGGSQ